MQELKQKIQQPINNSITWTIIGLLFGLILGIGIIQLIQTQELNLDNLLTTPEHKTSCASNTDCILAYTGPSACAPCDFTNEDYKCVSPEKAKIFQQKREKKYGKVLCKTCIMPPTPEPDCVCQNGFCAKKLNIPDKSDLIQVNIQNNVLISSPLIITGKARGQWFFEGIFPVYLFDGNNKKIATAIAQAQSEWMTEDFVSFKALIEFANPDVDYGTLVFEKNNASGRPEFDDKLSIPVRFSKTQTGNTDNINPECRPTGCSNIVCSDQDLDSTCEWKEEYSCYKNAVCERQATGECGWRQTQELIQCIVNAK
tara:strand:- start:7193 stop:8131 length:939 start_codon:yes stop_codon:yes gene_type:complete